MAVAFDAATESATWTSTDPFTFDHTPSGTPKGVMVFVVSDPALDYTAIVTGITYGGVAMSLVQGANDTVGEPGTCQVWFLGASIPTGTQTVSITRGSNTAATRIAWCVTVTASTDTEVKVSNNLQEDATNPQISLNSGSDTTQRYFAIKSGLSAVGDLTLVGSMTAIHDHDYGTKMARVDRETGTSSGSTTVGYTGVSDDVAMVALAVGEVAAGGAYVPFDHYGVSGFFGV